MITLEKGGAGVNIWISILIMMVIGGFIGMMTNFIAIRMLFRPYKAIFLGKWRLPFTPGLIPKRRDELAQKIGQVVTEHLLTGDMIQKKLQDEGLRDGLTETAQEFFKEKMALETTPTELAEFAGFQNGKERLVDWVSNKAVSETERFLNEKETTKLEKLIPDAANVFLLKNLAGLSEMGIARATDYLQSDAGKKQIHLMLETFFEEHGKMGSFAKMFLNVDALTEKAQRELEKLLKRPEMKETLENLLITEYQALLESDLGELVSPKKKEDFFRQVGYEARCFLENEKWLNRPIQENLAKYEEQITGHLIPYIVERLLAFASSHSTDLFNRLEIAVLIESQIATFSLHEMEQIVISISGKELKMITYLGGILGGVIGIVQGVLTLWI